jgi:hypothetical protein
MVNQYQWLRVHLVRASSPKLREHQAASFKPHAASRKLQAASFKLSDS